MYMFVTVQPNINKYSCIGVALQNQTYVRYFVPKYVGREAIIILLRRIHLPNRAHTGVALKRSHKISQSLIFYISKPRFRECNFAKVIYLLPLEGRPNLGKEIKSVLCICGKKKKKKRYTSTFFCQLRKFQGVTTIYKLWKPCP